MSRHTNIYRGKRKPKPQRRALTARERFEVLVSLFASCRRDYKYKPLGSRDKSEDAQGPVTIIA